MVITNSFHTTLKHKLVDSMFRLDDFLRWKRRGLSDIEAHESVEDLYEYGYVVWRDGRVQYIEDSDSDFESEGHDVDDRRGLG